MEHINVNRCIGIIGVTKTNKINPASPATLERERESEYLSGIADQLETEEIHERNESLYTIQKRSMSQRRQETSRRKVRLRCVNDVVPCVNDVMPQGRQ